MSSDAFLAAIVFFVFSCGNVLIFSGWPRRFRQPEVTELLAAALGGVMVFVSGYGLAMLLV
jgi:hypothetical protein